ncbi:hypothetical protein MAR_018379 [Mya arenaria]|uniref:HTH psq-type domain-containing protein n=1 Tax=Mya arenaria TaxID=6604 RepID=A0ABY7EHZ5_MYAAR|nr:hypothetical protein MAR_018379 [Mya arenaria]
MPTVTDGIEEAMKAVNEERIEEQLDEIAPFARQSEEDACMAKDDEISLLQPPNKRASFYDIGLDLGGSVDTQQFPTIYKVKRRQYDATLLNRAFSDVKEKGMSVYKASREYGVPESTLRDRTLGQQPTGDLPYAGPGPLFSKNEESQPVEHVAYMARIGYGYSRQEFMSLATDYAISLKKKIEMDSPLAPSWFNGFRKRNPEVTMTKPQKLSVIRAKCTSEEVLNNYFKELDKVLKAHNLHESPESIWNIDESGLQTEHSPRKILCMQGEKANTVTSNRGQTVTLTGCGSASDAIDNAI